jgi:2',3'-cyclic-nucleotide 2'-phosphodiesterase (5'-nucleotidase family)
MLLRFLILFLGLGFLASKSFAKVLQIIHTNDLHSYFMGTRGGNGGYAQLKKVIDELKSEAASQDIPTLYLDGGDFGEGSSFYFSNHGVDSLRGLDLLGVDVAVLGNHDFILGTTELKRQIKKAGLKAKIISSNLKGKEVLGMSGIIPDYVDYQFHDLKLRIIGLTTSEIHFLYPLRPLGYISSPIKTGLKQEALAHDAGIDFTIALTHIGIEEDFKLAQESRFIDLIIGGHSHTLLNDPQMTKNSQGRLIPVVQAGAHSGYVGSLLVDVNPKGGSRILSYKIHPVKKEMPQDEKVRAFVEEAYARRETYFNRDWNEVIGYSEFPFSGDFNGTIYTKKNCWSRHMARLTKDVLKADLGIQFDNFQGEMISEGPITFGDMIDNFPHFRKWGDEGWKVGRLKVSGLLLKQILKALSKSEFADHVTIDGVTVFDFFFLKSKVFDPKNHSPEEALVDNQPINHGRYYTVALPSEIPHALLKMLNVLAYGVFPELRVRRDLSYWPLLENYIRENSPLRCIEE